MHVAALAVYWEAVKTLKNAGGNINALTKVGDRMLSMLHQWLHMVVVMVMDYGYG
jgi:hypothetical protein